MDLSDKQIKIFQKLFLTEFNTRLSFEEAKEKATKFICLYKTIYFPTGDY